MQVIDLKICFFYYLMCKYENPLKFSDYVDPVEKAPFDIDQDHVKIMSNEERIKVCRKNM